MECTLHSTELFSIRPLLDERSQEGSDARTRLRAMTTENIVLIRSNRLMSQFTEPVVHTFSRPLFCPLPDEDRSFQSTTTRCLFTARPSMPPSPPSARASSHASTVAATRSTP